LIQGREGYGKSKRMGSRKGGGRRTPVLLFIFYPRKKRRYLERRDRAVYQEGRSMSYSSSKKRCERSSLSRTAWERKGEKDEIALLTAGGKGGDEVRKQTVPIRVSRGKMEKGGGRVSLGGGGK